MRRKPNREINTLSISALDLFATAMGVFLLVAIVALPYYLKADPDLVSQIGKMKKQIKDLKSENRYLKDRQMTTFLGIATTAKSFVMVVDMSGSMEKYTKIVMETADRIIGNLSDKYKLQVMGYHQEHTILPWKRPFDLAVMNRDNKKAALNFVGSLTSQFSGGTPTYLALEEALKYDAEAIILLTDGAPSFYAPADIVKRITASNGGRKKIYSIAIGDYRAMPILVDFLETLSRNNGGMFLGVSNY